MMTLYNDIIAAIDSGYRVIIAERSLVSNKEVFGELCRSKLTTPEKCIYDTIYNELWHSLANRCSVYTFLLTTPPDTCLHRLRMRDRREETSVSLDYLQHLHTLYAMMTVKYDTGTSLIRDGTPDAIVADILAKMHVLIGSP
jgi:deoxyadenosine/deoxycytidine kinase